MYTNIYEELLDQPGYRIFENDSPKFIIINGVWISKIGPIVTPSANPVCMLYFNHPDLAFGVECPIFI